MNTDKAREALIERYAKPFYGRIVGCPDSVIDQTFREFADALAALRTPEAPEAVEPLAEFGHGNIGVDTGTVHGKPAVFIRPLDHNGPVGDKLPPEKQIKGPQASLEPGEFCLAFPTMGHARRVADALVTTSPEPEAVTSIFPTEQNDVNHIHPIAAPAIPLGRNNDIDCGGFSMREPINDAVITIRPKAAAPEGRQDHGEKINTSALDVWFPDGVPVVAVKIMFPEKSSPLTTAEIRHILAALASNNRPAEQAVTVDEVERIILDTEPAVLSDRGDRIWTRRMAVALSARLTAAREAQGGENG